MSIEKARKVCLGYTCSVADDCSLYIQHVSTLANIRHWMSPKPGKFCDHFKPLNKENSHAQTL